MLSETDMKCPLIQDGRATSALRSSREDEIFYRPHGTNTELKEHGSMNVMTSNWIKTFNSNETQMTPKPSFPLGPHFPALISARNQPINKSVANDISIGETKLEAKKDFTTQVTHLQPSLMFRGTETSHSPAESFSFTNKLKTYLNTGMILNTMLEQAVAHGSPMISTFADTKSIGNKYTSDIGTCTNNVLKDSVIETEKEISPRRYSANTNTFLKQESKFTEQDEAIAERIAKQTRLENGTQYSYIYQKGKTQSLLRSEGIGESCLISVRSLANSVSEAAQTEITFCDDCQPKPQQISKMRATRNSGSNLNASYSLDEQVLSNLDAEKWITAGIEKAYQPLIEIKRATTFKDVDRRNNQNSSDLTSKSMLRTSDETSCQHIDQMSLKHSNHISGLKSDQLLNQQSDQLNNQIGVHPINQTSSKHSYRTGFQPESQHINQHIEARRSNERNTRPCDSGTQSNHSSFQTTKQFVKSSEGNMKSIFGDSSTMTSSVTLGKLGSQPTMIPIDQSRNIISAQLRNPQLSDRSKSEFHSLVPEDNKNYFGDDNIKGEPKCKLRDLIDVQPSDNIFVPKINNALIDVLNTKELKEIDLQACPLSSDAATECVQENKTKSASVLTSRCILPCLSHCVCEHHRSGNLSGDCLFVYDKPRCIVHNIKQKVSGDIQPLLRKPCVQVQSVGVNVNTYFRSQSKISAAFSKHRSETSKQSLQKEALKRMSSGFRNHSNTSARSMQENEDGKAAESEQSFQIPVLDKMHVNDTFKSQSIVSTDSTRLKIAESSKICVRKSGHDKMHSLQSQSTVSTGSRRQNEAAFSKLSLQKSDLNKMHVNSYFKSQSIMSTDTLGQNEALSSFLSLGKDTFDKTEKTASEDNVTEKTSVHFGMAETVVEKCGVQSVGINVKSCKCQSNTSVGCINQASQELCKLHYPNEIPAKTILKLRKESGITRVKVSDEENVRDSDDYGAVETAVEIMIKAQLQPPDVPPAKKSTAVSPSTPAETQITKSALAAMLKGKMHSVEVMAVPMVKSANITTSRYFYEAFPEENNIIESAQGSSHTTSQVLDVKMVKGEYGKYKAEELNKAIVEKEVSKDKPDEQDGRAEVEKEDSKVNAEEESKAEIEKEDKQVKAEEENSEDMPEKNNKVIPHKCEQADAEQKSLKISIIRASKAGRTVANVETAKRTAEMREFNTSDRTLAAENRPVQMRVAHKSDVMAPLPQVKAFNVCHCSRKTNTAETQVTRFEYNTITKYPELEAKESKERAIILCNLADGEAATLLRAEMHSVAILAAPILHSATAMTSRCLCRTFAAETQVSHPNNIGARKNLATSYRYYTALLTRHLDQVIENFANHFAEPNEASHLAGIFYAEACTMKPSARKEFACQTLGPCSKDKMTLNLVISDSNIFRHDNQSKLRNSVLDPTISVTDICRHDKEHLKSVYYLLSAIEGRLRRFQTSIDDCQ